MFNYTSYFEIMVDSHATVRNNRDLTNHYPLFHNVNFLQTIIQCHNQHTDIEIVKIQHLSIITSIPDVFL